MSQFALRSDALCSTGDGFEVRIGLPWIRSMPLSGIRELALVVDGEPVAGLSVLLGGRRLDPAALQGVPSWWYLQDRLVLTGARALAPGVHSVAVDFRLLVAYLQAGPGTPLVLPFRLEADLVLDAPGVPSVARDVA